jgi:hypothetical protein
MDKTEVKEIRNIFDSIICLAVEGPDATSIRAVINQIIKEAGLGLNLCDRHLTIGTDTKKRCECSGFPLESDYCKYCGGYKGPLDSDELAQWRHEGQIEHFAQMRREAASLAEIERKLRYKRGSKHVDCCESTTKECISSYRLDGRG